MSTPAATRLTARHLGHTPVGLGPRLAPSLALTCFGAAGAVGADLTPNPGLLYTASAIATGAGLAGAVLAAREQPRAELLATLCGALAPLIGRDGRVTARKWRGGWIGTPERVRIDYDPQAAIEATDWQARLMKVVASRLGCAYRLVTHDVRRSRVVLARVAPAAAPPSAELAKRVDTIVSTIFGADATVKITWDQAQVAALDVHHRIGVRIAASSALRHNIAATVSTMLAGRWRARWDLEADRVRLELRPEIPATLQKNLDPPTGAERNRLPYMVDEDGSILYWDLSSSAGTPHVLVIGPTGSGKTVMIRGLVVEACRRAWRVRICDPKRIEFVGLRDWPNVEFVATTITDIVAAIHQTYLEMMRRYELIETGQAFAGDFDRVVLVLDEYRYFYGVVNAWYQGVKATGGSRACPILEEVFLIASLGRAAGVHIVLGTQRPDADWLGGDVRDQFQCRASLGRLSPDGAKMCWGDYITGVSVPRRRPGRGISVSPDGEPVEAQAYWTPDPVRASEPDEQLLAALRPTETRWPALAVQPVPDVDEAGNPIPAKGRYQEYRDAALVPSDEQPDRHAAARTTPVDDLSSYLQGDGAEAAASGGRGGFYGPVEHAHANQLRGGDLICLDEASDTWAVVETAEDDLGNPDQVCICWRSDEQGEDYGVLVVDGSNLLPRRAPADSTGHPDDATEL